SAVWAVPVRVCLGGFTFSPCIATFTAAADLASVADSREALAVVCRRPPRRAPSVCRGNVAGLGATAAGCAAAPAAADAVAIPAVLGAVAAFVPVGMAAAGALAIAGALVPAVACAAAAVASDPVAMVATAASVATALVFSPACLPSFLNPFAGSAVDGTAAATRAAIPSTSTLAPACPTSSSAASVRGA
ncbi:unnamed protein product, partial [Closterium sp. NIES-53]